MEFTGSKIPEDGKENAAYLSYPFVLSVISYNKLWKLLIDKKMKKKDLRLSAGVSTAVIAKLGKGENVTTDFLLKICKVLNCDITDIMEIERDEIVNTNSRQGGSVL